MMGNPTNGLKTEILERTIEASLFAYFRAISILNERAGVYGVVYLPDGQMLAALERLEKGSQHLLDLLNQVERTYVKLTSCDWYGEDDEIQGVQCPNELLREFDKVLLRPAWK